MMHKLIFIYYILCVQLTDISSGTLASRVPGREPPQASQCGENEIIGCWNECEIQCPTFYNLNVPQPRNCTECLEGCICKPGFIRNPVNGVCIGKDYCSIPDDVCITHEMFSVCGAACQISCMSLMLIQHCTSCIPGYVCMPGYVRNPTTGLCITPIECPQPLLDCYQPGEIGRESVLVNMLRKAPPKEN